jgi:hypothetical protein
MASTVADTGSVMPPMLGESSQAFASPHQPTGSALQARISMMKHAASIRALCAANQKSPTLAAVSIAGARRDNRVIVGRTQCVPCCLFYPCCAPTA